MTRLNNANLWGDRGFAGVNDHPTTEARSTPAEALDVLLDAARAVLPEVIDAEIPSAITSDDPMAGIDRMKAVGDRWERLRATVAALSPHNREDDPSDLSATPASVATARSSAMAGDATEQPTTPEGIRLLNHLAFDGVNLDLYRGWIAGIEAEARSAEYARLRDEEER